MAKQKKLSSNDINKNSSVQISHSINKIKENELKYTIILVIIFMVVFVIAGYVSLKVSNDYIVNNISSYGLTFSSNVITLTNKNILDDESALQEDGVLYTIVNNNSNKYKYRLFLKEDEDNKEKCGCNGTIDYNLIKYSIDDNVINNLNDDMVIFEGEISGNAVLQNRIKFWISDSTNFEENDHFHGKIVLEELK